MATFEPPEDLFAVQLESLRAQTHENWICLISDDCSSPEGLARIESAVRGDGRFVVSASERRLGFYRNFERALGMAPAEARLVALCDQDDRWHPEKLATLREAIGEAHLAYSDQRLVDADGTVLTDTFWAGRTNNHTNLASMLVANTVTGAATLMRREVVDRALPFPNQPGWQFHDHWIALVALASGDLAYVDTPLYDYVQHRGAILGQVAADPDASKAPPSLRSRLGARVRAWRPAYFCGYTRLAVQAETVLMRCDGLLTRPKRRALERFVAARRSPLAFAWLAARPLRRLAGHGETLGAESQLARGIAWRRTVSMRAAMRRPRRFAPDASIPACGPDSFQERRLRRWRSRMGTRSGK
jgi:glycosyltransferase involved in cell wall biosynthesis